MNRSLIAVRYAKALFKLAKEKDQVEQIQLDLKLVDAALSASKDLIMFLESPIQKNSKKKEIISLLFEKSIQPICFNFLNLIIDKKRENFLAQIIRDYIDLYRKDKNIKNVVFISAAKIEDSFLSQFKSIIEKLLSSTIDLTYEQDASLIGGFILTIDGKLMDASISSKLKSIKKQLLN